MAADTDFVLYRGLADVYPLFGTPTKPRLALNYHTLDFFGSNSVDSQDKQWMIVRTLQSANCAYQNLCARWSRARRIVRHQDRYERRLARRSQLLTPSDRAYFDCCHMRLDYETIMSPDEKINLEYKMMKNIYPKVYGQDHPFNFKDFYIMCDAADHLLQSRNFKDSDALWIIYHVSQEDIKGTQYAKQQQIALNGLKKEIGLAKSRLTTAQEQQQQKADLEKNQAVVVQEPRQRDEDALIQRRVARLENEMKESVKEETQVRQKIAMNADDEQRSLDKQILMSKDTQAFESWKRRVVRNIDRTKTYKELLSWCSLILCCMEASFENADQVKENHFQDEQNYFDIMHIIHVDIMHIIHVDEPKQRKALEQDYTSEGRGIVVNFKEAKKHIENIDHLRRFNDQEQGVRQQLGLQQNEEFCAAKKAYKIQTIHDQISGLLKKLSNAQQNSNSSCAPINPRYFRGQLSEINAELALMSKNSDNTHLFKSRDQLSQQMNAMFPSADLSKQGAVASGKKLLKEGRA